MTSRLSGGAALNTLIDRSAPVGSAAAVTPADGADLPTVANGLYVGVTGDVKVDLADAGTAILFKAVAAGFFPIRAKRVYATGTTATNIIAIL